MRVSERERERGRDRVKEYVVRKETDYYCTVLTAVVDKVLIRVVVDKKSTKLTNLNKELFNIFSSESTSLSKYGINLICICLSLLK